MIAKEYEILEAIRLVQTLENKISQFGMMYPNIAQANFNLKKVRDILTEFKRFNENKSRAIELQQVTARQMGMTNGSS